MAHSAPRRVITALAMIFLVALVTSLSVDRFLRPASRGPRASAAADEPTHAPRRVAPRAAVPPQPPATAPAESESRRRETEGFTVLAAEDQRPIERAVIWLVDRNQVIAKGVTGPDGRFVPTNTVSATRMVVTAPGFEDHDAPSTADAVVQLRTGASISGQVRLPTGTAPAAPIRVIAFELSRNPVSTDAIDLAMSGGPGKVAITDNDGRFTIGGMIHGGKYTLLVAGDGLASVRSTIVAEAGGAPIEVVVAAVYGLYLRVSDPAGGAIEGSPMMSRGANGWSSDKSPLGTYSPTSPVMRWLGVAALDPSTVGPADTCAIILSGDELKEWGPLHFVVDAPGYSSQKLDVMAPRLTNGHLFVQDVALQRTCDGFGKIRLKAGANDSVLLELLSGVHLRRGRASASLMLNSSSTRFSLDVSALGRESMDISGIPEGRYRIAFNGDIDRKHVRLEPDDLLITPGSVSEVSLTFENWAGIEVRVRKRGVDAEYTGPLTVNMRRVRDSYIVSRSFDAAPYRIAPLDAAEYRLIASTRGHSSGWQSMLCLERQVTPAAVQLEPIEVK